MIAKLSLMSLIYEMLEKFSFPDEKVQKIFVKYLIEKVYIYHVLTDTDSTCLQFLFISDPKSDICERKYRDIIFQVMIASDIYDRFDSLHVYWAKFSARKENLRKCPGYFEIGNIDNPCFLTIACNPKEYYELFENSYINKRHKGIKKGLSGINFVNYAERFVSLTNFNIFEKLPADYKKVSHLTVFEGKMKKKTKFSQLMTGDVIFPMQLPRCPCLIPI